jgi:hypothetical protein
VFSISNLAAPSIGLELQMDTQGSHVEVKFWRKGEVYDAPGGNVLIVVR